MANLNERRLAGVERGTAPYGPLLGTARRHVLLAEDNSEMRKLLATVLSEDGYDVTQVCDGGRLFDAVRAIANEARFDEPHIVVTDLRMPFFSGLDAIELLRILGRSTPVLVVTAFGDEETHARAKKLSARVLDKPFEMDAFRCAVFELLSRHAASNEITARGEESAELCFELEPYVDGWLPVRRRIGPRGR